MFLGKAMTSIPLFDGWRLGWSLHFMTEECSYFLPFFSVPEIWGRNVEEFLLSSQGNHHSSVIARSASTWSDRTWPDLAAVSLFSSTDRLQLLAAFRGKTLTFMAVNLDSRCSDIKPVDPCLFFHSVVIQPSFVRVSTRRHGNVVEKQWLMVELLF